MKIDWENISKEEAQQIADELTSAFSVAAKCNGSDEMSDVSYLEVMGIYDDNLHTDKSKRKCGVDRLPHCISTTNESLLITRRYEDDVS